jgi:hypothetical protein
MPNQIQRAVSYSVEAFTVAWLLRMFSDLCEQFGRDDPCSAAAAPGDGNLTSRILSIASTGGE